MCISQKTVKNNRMSPLYFNYVNRQETENLSPSKICIYVSTILHVEELYSKMFN